jgi:hypothetical protein
MSVAAFTFIAPVFNPAGAGTNDASSSAAGARFALIHRIRAERKHQRGPA